MHVPVPCHLGSTRAHTRRKAFIRAAIQVHAWFLRAPERQNDISISFAGGAFAVSPAMLAALCHCLAFYCRGIYSFRLKDAVGVGLCGVKLLVSASERLPRPCTPFSIPTSLLAATGADSLSQSGRLPDHDMRSS